MSELYLDILRIGRRNGTLSFETLKEMLVSKGYEWNEIQDPTQKWFADTFESVSVEMFILKVDAERWLLDYEAKKEGNTAHWLIFLILICIGLKLVISPNVVPRSRIKGFEN